MVFCSFCQGEGHDPQSPYRGRCTRCGGTGMASDQNRLTTPARHSFQADRFADQVYCEHCGREHAQKCLHCNDEHASHIM
jgi:DnaJ-class molecular chaperone